MGRVLSQSEIDNLLSNLLTDASVLPDEEPVESSEPSTIDNIPAGILAFKAKLDAAKNKE